MPSPNADRPPVHADQPSGHEPNATGTAALNAEIDRLMQLSEQLEQLMDTGAATADDVERAAQVNRDLLALL